MEGEISQGRHDAALAWFSELQRDCIVKNGIIPEWFHGIISRKAAEEILLSKPAGYFLIRVSESRIGYTLSYRAEDRCRHFMIDVLQDNQYIIVGEDVRHRSLQDMVAFHRRTPILPFNELLTVACGQVSKDKTDYAELLFPKRKPLNPDAWTINPPHMTNKSHVKPSEDTPPALPHRSTMSDTEVTNLSAKNTPVPPTSHPPRLYPCLETEIGAVSLQSMMNTAKPVPLPRAKYPVNSAQLDQPPELPARGLLPQRKEHTTSGGPGPGPMTVATERLLVSPSTLCEDKGNNQQRNQDVKSAVISLKHFKRKFQKKRSASEENMYAEITVEDEIVQDNTTQLASENEYSELSGESQIHESHKDLSTDTGVMARSTDGALPLEYLHPSPFAPGY